MKYEVFMFGCKSIAERAVFRFKKPANNNDIRNKHVIQGHYDGDWG